MIVKAVALRGAAAFCHAQKTRREVRRMTKEWLNEMGLGEEDCGLLMEKWESRETEHSEAIGKLREELELPFRAVGLVPGEGRDGLPENDAFLSGFNI